MEQVELMNQAFHRFWCSSHTLPVLRQSVSRHSTRSVRPCTPCETNLARQGKRGWAVRF